MVAKSEELEAKKRKLESAAQQGSEARASGLSEAERASGMEEQKATEIADTGEQEVERESEEPMVIEEAIANRKRSAEDEPDDSRAAQAGQESELVVDNDEEDAAMLGAIERRKAVVERIVGEEFTSVKTVMDLHRQAEHMGESVRGRRADIDEAAGTPEDYGQDSTEAGVHDETQISAVGGWESIDDKKRVKNHPGPIVSRKNIPAKDLQWRSIGSGTFAKTFLDASRLLTTTNSGPPIGDIWKRTIWCLRTGKVIDQCIVDDMTDEELNRKLPVPTDIRVEVEVRGAMDLFRKVGGDIVEVYSQPRISQVASVRDYGGNKVTTGWSFDLTRANPKTGLPWDLSLETNQREVLKVVRESKPLFVIGSPPCTPFSILQNISKHRRDPKVIEWELEMGRRHLKFCVQLYRLRHSQKCFFHTWAPEYSDVMGYAGEGGTFAIERRGCCRYRHVRLRDDHGERWTRRAGNETHQDRQQFTGGAEAAK